MTESRYIPIDTKLRLFSDAAGHCQRPECLQPLFPPELGRNRHIAEMAHIISHGETGPRNEERPAEGFEVNSFENLILLCPTCHKIVDKDPVGYSRSTLLGWKNNHSASLALKQKIFAYAERHQVRDAIVVAMNENKAVWQEFAPYDGMSFEYNPESENAKTWTQRMRSVILPNHFRIQAIIKANLHLMTEAEGQILARYQEHIRGLSERHICGISGGAIRYPEEMETIFA